MSEKRIQREKLTIRNMLTLYQRRCPDANPDDGHYDALYAFAEKRLDRCVFGTEKPACRQCPVHCYPSAKREEMKQVMRWAGPRMLWRHPLLTVLHLLDDKKPVPELPEKYRKKK
ncbi:nitrous oxide-stimulated promoter family protein [Enterobacillus tribolii]|nr:nitrous oxide-stimulated promoter family protein [Enterobacillus tribolii]MBW7983385.1 nitrous oxide-stimulated promoter family protein [Enterobacillus tribolii]